VTGERPSEVVKTLEEVEVASALHPLRRLVIRRRDDGNFTYAEQYFYMSEWEGRVVASGWHTLFDNGIFATAALAESEGRAEFARWHGLSNYRAVIDQ
jgi:hypothetical protein